MEILLSIIIPGYGHNEYADRLLKQLDKQMQNNVEVLLIDDCSPIPYEFNYKWLKIIRLKENSGGASVPRNVGLDNAKGKYISFIDIDDSVSPYYIETILNKTKSDWDYCYMSWQTENKVCLITDEPPSWNCCIWNCIYKKELIGEVRFRPDLIKAEDYYFNLAVKKGKKANIEDVLYTYNNIPNSLSKREETYNKKYKESD